MGGADGRRPIVVGVDPDPSKRLAIAWAADEADRRALPLRLVHARGALLGRYRSEESRPVREQWSQALETAGERVLREAVAFVESRQPSVEVSASLAGRGAGVGPARGGTERLDGRRGLLAPEHQA